MNTENVAINSRWLSVEVFRAKHERKVRKRYGFLIPLGGKEVFRTRQDRLFGMHILPSTEWKDLEVSEGLHVPLPPVFSYQGSSLRDFDSTLLWSAFYVEWAATVVAFSLCGIYSICRLIHIPPLIVDIAGTIWDSLEELLGDAEARDDLGFWLDMVNEIHWDDEMIVFSSRKCCGGSSF